MFNQVDEEELLNNEEKRVEIILVGKKKARVERRMDGLPKEYVESGVCPKTGDKVVWMRFYKSKYCLQPSYDELWDRLKSMHMFKMMVLLIQKATGDKLFDTYMANLSKS